MGSNCNYSCLIFNLLHQGAPIYVGDHIRKISCFSSTMYSLFMLEMSSKTLPITLVLVCDGLNRDKLYC